MPIAKIYLNAFLTDESEESLLDDVMKCNVNHAFVANIKCNDEKALSSSLELLEKHGLISLKYEEKLVNIKSIPKWNEYFEFTKYSRINEIIEQFGSYDDLSPLILIRRGVARLTNYGEHFLVACIDGENMENFIKSINEIGYSFLDEWGDKI